MQFQSSRRKPTSFAALLALVVIIGAGAGVGAHYLSSGDGVDLTETAAVVIAPLKSKTIVTPAVAMTLRRFNLCSGSVRVTCVVDGDTIWLDGTKIRIADIDAPEVSKPRCKSEKALGDRATRRLLQLVNGGPFELQAWPGRDEDKYGRKLRVLVRGGRSLGNQLVAEGLARTWSGRKQPWC